jgi:mannose-1-phosphate guanylyltransferase/mannose-1-phosphate guanylyltransferase/mannose-6-phosphate isomerase
MRIRPIILSGGSGTRLWPVSRQRQPKQFMPLLGRQTLFATALGTTADKPGFAPPLVVGSADHKFLILDILEQTGTLHVPPVLEPVGRNTAAAALVAALAETEEDILHLVRPSDHIINDETAFIDAVTKAAPAAKGGAFVLFGIAPTHPETGYGYIMPGNANGSVQPIAAFKEKPDEKNAQALIKQGALWNSGIFLYAPKALIKEAEMLAPELLAQCRAALQKAKPDLGCVMLDAEAYKGMASEPFDRVIMERTKRGAVVSCAMGWSDVGSWQALWQLATKDSQHNMRAGSVITRDVTNSYIRSDGPTVAALGLDDIMIIATKDAVLVAPRSRSQDVKNIVDDLRKDNKDMTLDHPRVMRPWGSYEGIAEGQNFQVKQIVVRPGRSLSLQMHHHRAEHWIVVAGTAKVEIDGVEKLVFPNESVYIPKATKHRLGNPGKADLHLIEVQSGDYLGEDDIVRFADNYGRGE